MAEPSFAEILEAATARCRAMDAPLEVRLRSFADVVADLGPAFTGVVERMVTRLIESGAGGTAPVCVAEQRAELIARAQSAAHALID